MLESLFRMNCNLPRQLIENVDFSNLLQHNFIGTLILQRLKAVSLKILETPFILYKIYRSVLQSNTQKIKIGNM